MSGSLGGEDPRPLRRQNLQEFVDDLPVRGEVVRNQVSELRETGAFRRYGVEKPR